ncbi:uncharacterized protein B0H64DRAFT_232790 [Chaetomium fimeti]|uniref:Uncharacterized protein n=1 Tax=Chaetomium fimeti TaxID=1854472 RepID=A0AAE0H9V3_9PEZI|nr:hypothetical protein B0H64DRAFT_232790 [Chaetomium fimeti]
MPSHPMRAIEWAGQDPNPLSSVHPNLGQSRLVRARVGWRHWAQLDRAATYRKPRVLHNVWGLRELRRLGELGAAWCGCIAALSTWSLFLSATFLMSSPPSFPARRGLGHHEVRVHGLSVGSGEGRCRRFRILSRSQHRLIQQSPWRRALSF